MTTTPEAVEAAKKFAEVGPANISDHSTWWKAATELAPHKCAEKQESIYEACIRILAARVRELEREDVDTKRLDWLETQANQLPEMMGAPRTLSCSILCAGANTVREAIDTMHPQPEQAKQADEVLYGLEGQELLDDDVETIVSHLLHENFEKPGESFDVVADRIQWPVKVLEFRRMKVSDAVKNSLAASTLESVIDCLDEDHAGPDGTSNKPTAPMQLAARRFVDEVTRHYVVWNCEPTGEVVEITREKAKEIVG